MTQWARRWGAARVLFGALIAATTVLTACTGVPDSSSPQVVQSVDVQPQPPQGVVPAAGADPRSIVSGFLTNNASEDAHHSAAKAFLTPEAKNRWSDSTQTQIIDGLQIGNFENDTVTVSGRLIGTLAQSGAYSPSLPGDGQGVRGAGVSFQIGLTQVDGQWRIDKVPNGLLITADQFAQYYTQYFVYFYDQAQQILVPDPRYSPLRDAGELATWLMSQLVVQPRPSLSTALPSIPNVDQIKVNLGSSLKVDVPGSSQLDSPTRNRMAQQIAATLDQASPGVVMTITDGGAPVTIPQVGDAQFAAAQFPDPVSPANQEPALYYIARGGVVGASGTPLPGGIGSGQYGLRSVALASVAGSQQLLVAGTSGPAASARLLVGRSNTALTETTVRGALSRPAWVPNYDEVWVGDGKTLYRVGANRKAQPVQLTASSGTVTGSITALRFSPEGARVALVIKADDQTSQVWVGDVVRSPDSVRVSGLSAISPLDVAVTDVAWNDPGKLFVIGHELSNDEGGVYEVQCDGSVWLPRGIGNLPPDPDSITVAENVVAAVSAGGMVWVQHTGGTWTSPTGKGAAYGTNPVYLE